MAHGIPVPDEAAGPGIELPPVFLTNWDRHRVQVKNAGGFQHAERFPQKLRAIPANDAAAIVVIKFQGDDETVPAKSFLSASSGAKP